MALLWDAIWQLVVLAIVKVSIFLWCTNCWNIKWPNENTNCFKTKSIINDQEISTTYSQKMALLRQKNPWNSRSHTCIHTQMIYKQKMILVSSIFSSSWSCGRPDQKVNFKHWLEFSGCSLLLSTFSWFHNTSSCKQY